MSKNQRDQDKYNYLFYNLSNYNTFTISRIKVIPVPTTQIVVRIRTAFTKTLWITVTPIWAGIKARTSTITSVVTRRSTAFFTFIRIQVIPVRCTIKARIRTAFGTSIGILELSIIQTIGQRIRWTARFAAVRIIVRPISTRTAINVTTTFGTTKWIVIEPRGTTVVTCTAADLAAVRIVEVSVLEALRFVVGIATLHASGGVEVDSMCAGHATTTHRPVLVDVVTMRTRGAARMIPKHSDNDQGDHPEAHPSQWDSVRGFRTTQCTAIVFLFDGLSAKHWKR